MTQTQTHPALGFLSGRQLTPVSAAALRLVVLLVKWEERRHTRKGLKNMDDHLLSDIGISRSEAERELAARPWTR
ncbi:DUF1127 domain-containing protein [Nioella aestuarii]|uniref:DUF1127 domain-containing protein n=1 Tax=Nioella aestuarii TaxID=1662864 RepID=UPI003D7FBF3F